MRMFFALILFGLSACTQAPFVDLRREAGVPYTIGESNADRVAVCYNSFSTNEPEILNMAREECAKTNREPRYDGHKYWSCRVFLPHRVYYKCMDKPGVSKEENAKENERE